MSRNVFVGTAMHINRDSPGEIICIGVLLPIIGFGSTYKPELFTRNYMHWSARRQFIDDYLRDPLTLPFRRCINEKKRTYSLMITFRFNFFAYSVCASSSNYVLIREYIRFFVNDMPTKSVISAISHVYQCVVTR